MSRTNYHEAASMAVCMLALAIKHEDKGQRDDIARAATQMFWHAARADAFRFVKDNFIQTMKAKSHPDEIIVVATAALQNIADLEAASERCNTLIDLLLPKQEAKHEA